MSTQPGGYLIGQLCGSRGVFATSDLLSPFAGGRAQLRPIQPCVPLLRYNRQVGVVVAGEQSYAGGVYLLAELGGGFKMDTTNVWLSPRFTEPHRVASARGRQVALVDLVLEQVTLTPLPGVFNPGAAQVTLLDPRRARGGYSWRLPELTEQHKGVCARFHAHDEHIGHRRGDEFGLCTLLMPESSHAHHRTARPTGEGSSPVPAPAAVGSGRPAPKSMQRLADAGLDAAWVDGRGRVVHSRRLGTLELR